MALTDFSKTLTEKKTVYGKSKSSSFKTCATCPSPAKCRAAKRCLKKSGGGSSMGGSDRRRNRGSSTM